MRVLFLLIALMCFSMTSNTIQAQFKLSGEVRPRTEFRNGFKQLRTKADQPAVFIEQRSRINMDYNQPKYTVRLSLQDVRFWGTNNQIFKNDNNPAFVSEAWGEYKLDSTWSVKFGRQIISYDDQRYFGGLEWAQQGRRHDAIVLKNENKAKGKKFHLGFAFNQDDGVAEPAFIQSPNAAVYDVGGNYKSLLYAWYNKKNDNGEYSLLLADVWTPNTDASGARTAGLSGKLTAGLIRTQKVGNSTLGGHLYYQFGQINNKNVSAYDIDLHLTIKLNKTPLTFGAEYISGQDSNDTSSTITAFNPDFGTNHKFNGFMDYFFVGPANGNVGVTDIYVKTKIDFAKGKLNIHGHHFLTGSDQFKNGDELSATMGTEIDLVYARKLSKEVSFNVGYSQMFGTSTMADIRSTATNQYDEGLFTNWMWAMITFKPTFFTSK